MSNEIEKRQYVGIILVKPDGSVLAQHRDNIPTILGPDTNAVVGGRRDEGDESLEAAAARELEEETDYVVPIGELRFLTRDEYVPGGDVPEGRAVLTERTIFWAPYDGVQEINCNEGQAIRFVTPEELNELKIYEGHEGFFRKASEQVFNRDPERRG